MYKTLRNFFFLILSFSTPAFLSFLLLLSHALSSFCPCYPFFLTLYLSICLLISSSQFTSLSPTTSFSSSSSSSPSSPSTSSPPSSSTSSPSSFPSPFSPSSPFHLLLLLLLLLFIFLHLFFKIGGVWGSCVGAYQNFTEKWKDLLDEDFTDEFILANNNGPPWIYGTTGVRRLLVRSQQLYLWFYHLYIYLFCV